MILTYTLSTPAPTTRSDRTTSNMTVPDVDPLEATINDRLDALELAVTKVIVLLRYVDDEINMLADVVDLLMETPDAAESLRKTGPTPESAP